MTKELKYVDAVNCKETCIIPVNVMKEELTGEYVELMDAIDSATKLTTFNGFIVKLNTYEYYAVLLMKVNETTLTYREVNAEYMDGRWLVKDWQSHESAYNMMVNIVMAQSTTSIGVNPPSSQEIIEKLR